MPLKPLGPCPHLGCTNRTDCPKHSRAATTGVRHPDPRPTAALRGYDRNWQRIRAAFLRAYPTCDCGAPATEADHEIPLARGGTNEWANLHARCKPCHSRKTAERDGGFGNRRVTGQ